MSITFNLLLAVTLMFSSAVLYIGNTIGQKDDTYYDFEDEYATEMDEENLGKMIIQNYYLKEIIKDSHSFKSGQSPEKDNGVTVAPFNQINNNKIAFIMPTFTMAAYDNSFYPFYKKYVTVTTREAEDAFVTTDLHLLSSQVPDREKAFLHYKSNGIKHLADRISFLSPNMEVSFLTDTDVHNALLFDNNDQNLYKFIILAHQEYVTEEEYDNFKKFVENGGILILLDSNVFYAEVAYDPINQQTTLVQGHHWAFDGEKAWRDVKERWAEETTQWVGSNYGCGSSCSIDFNNNPFSYVHHEEQYVTNPNARILIDYQAQSKFNYLIAAYELEYGNGNVISFGIFGDDVISNKDFIQFFDDLFLLHVSLV
ncbi:MAG TPA: N,N-dimethylformamidase beta subunit family domain-containing protein [Nitrososphaeraceae archaeon]|nr:N,N-dimethylformamidase beta subunit family domain-containing protein [Nitrososphaeraceae archaeon]